MATDRSNDLRAFRHFIEAKLSAGGSNLTVDDVICLWDTETQRESERDANVKAIREALDDMHAGDTGIPADELMAPLRRKYGLPEKP
jgi:hypothetical protein